MKEHPGLSWLHDSASGRDWLERLPGLVASCAEAWSLEVGPPFAYAFASLAMPVTRVDGSQAVLKIQVPDRESENEAAALALLAGDGAVRLLDHDPQHHALLLERCDPGTPLAVLEPDEALDVMVDLLPRLWKPASSAFRMLAEEASWWRDSLEGSWLRSGRPFERPLLDAAIAALDELPATQDEEVLVNQDLHAANVLRAEREPWLMIDPKPLIGERAFGLVALVRGAELGEGPMALGHRLDRLTGELGIDRERTRRWGIAQTLAWAFDEGVGGSVDVDSEQVERARWFWRAD